jgi:hypothetical protein
MLYVTVKRQDSLVGIVTRLWVGQSRNRGLIPAGLRIAVFQSIQTGIGTLPSSCCGQQGFFPRDKLARVWVWSLTSTPIVKNSWALLPFPNIPSWHAWGQHGLVRKKAYSVLKQCCLFFVKLGIILNSASYLVNACFSTIIL